MYCNAPIAQLVEQIPLKDKVVGSIPTGRTSKEVYFVFASRLNKCNNCIVKIKYARVAKLADALALGASGVTLGGSSPLPRTM